MKFGSSRFLSSYFKVSTSQPWLEAWYIKSMLGRFSVSWFIYLFICWIVKWESSCFAITLLHQALPKVTSVLVYLSSFDVYLCFLAHWVIFLIAHFYLLLHVHSQWLGGSWLCGLHSYCLHFPSVRRAYHSCRTRPIIPKLSLITLVASAIADCRIAIAIEEKVNWEYLPALLIK